MKNNFDLSYLHLISKILSEGTLKEPARENMPRTLSLFGTRIEHDMREGFPLLTTKKVGWRSVIHELLWFLRGDINIKYLVDNNVHIWDQDAYRWYLKCCRRDDLNSRYDLNFTEFINCVRDENWIMNFSSYNKPENYTLGDLGKVYGKQWRNQNGVDQVQVALKRLEEEPMGRYAIIDAWNPSDFDEMALPPCHLLYQFNCREISLRERLKLMGVQVADNISVDGVEAIFEKEMRILRSRGFNQEPPKYYLDLQMYQRSADYFLGVPYNLASMGVLLTIFAKVLNYIPGKMVWVGGDTHLYENHLEQAGEQLQRIPYELPTLKINKKIKSINDIENLSIVDFVLVDYHHYPSIKAELKTGL